MFTAGQPPRLHSWGKRPPAAVQSVSRPPPTGPALLARSRADGLWAQDPTPAGSAAGVSVGMRFPLFGAYRHGISQFLRKLPNDSTGSHVPSVEESADARILANTGCAGPQDEAPCSGSRCGFDELPLVTDNNELWPRCCPARQRAPSLQ